MQSQPGGDPEGVFSLGSSSDWSVGSLSPPGRLPSPHPKPSRNSRRLRKKGSRNRSRSLSQVFRGLFGGAKSEQASPWKPPEWGGKGPPGGGRSPISDRFSGSPYSALSPVEYDLTTGNYETYTNIPAQPSGSHVASRTKQIDPNAYGSYTYDLAGQATEEQNDVMDSPPLWIQKPNRITSPPRTRRREWSGHDQSALTNLPSPPRPAGAPPRTSGGVLPPDDQFDSLNRPRLGEAHGPRVSFGGTDENGYHHGQGGLGGGVVGDPDDHLEYPEEPAESPIGEVPETFDVVSDGNYGYQAGPHKVGLSDEAKKIMKDQERVRLPSLDTPTPGVPVDAVLDLRSIVMSMHSESKFVRGCAHFSFFLIYFSAFIIIILLQQNTEQTQHVTFGIKETFLDQHFRDPIKDWNYAVKDITNVYQIWEWAEQIWAPELMTERNVPPDKGVPEAEVYSYESRLVDLPLIEQARSGKEECGDGLLPVRRECVSSDRSNQAFGPEADSTRYAADDSDRFRLRFWIGGNQPEAEPNEMILKTENLEQMRAQIRRMRGDEWIDRQTRWVKFQCSLFNPNLDAIILVRIIFAMPRTGLVTPFASDRDEWGSEHHGSILLIRRFVLYKKASDFIRMVLEIVFIGMTIYLTLREGLDLKNARKHGGTLSAHYSIYLGSGIENLYDLLVICVSWVSIGTFIFQLLRPRTQPGNETMLSEHGSSDLIFFMSNTVLFILFTYQFLKYVRFNHRWRFLTSTLGRALPELGNFILILFIVLVGYSLAGHYYWGTNLRSFSTIVRSIQTFLQLAIADPRTTFDDMVSPDVDSSRSIIPIFIYWTFIFTVFFILVNMFLAIVMRAYESTVSAAEGKRLVTRGWRERFTDSYPGGLLLALQSIGYVDKAYVDVPMGSDNGYLYSRRFLRLRVKTVKNSWKFMSEAKNMYICFPTRWKVALVGAEAEWFISHQKHQKRYRCNAELLHPNTVRMDPELSIELLHLKKPSQLVFLIPMVLRTPKRVNRLQGEGLPCMCQSGDWAFGMGDSFDDCPFVMKQRTITLEEITESIARVKEDIKEPKAGWTEVLDYCATMFEPDISDDEDDREFFNKAASAASPSSAGSHKADTKKTGDDSGAAQAGGNEWRASGKRI